MLVGGAQASQAPHLNPHRFRVGQGGFFVRGLECESGAPAHDLQQLQATTLGGAGTAVNALALGDQKWLGLRALAIAGQDTLLVGTEALVDFPVSAAKDLVVHHW